MRYSKILFFSLVIVFFFSCKKEKNTNFVVSGIVKGLTKGTIYLEKVVDTLIVPIDSFFVKDNGHFSVGNDIESPEIFYLYLKEIPTEKLLIFGEPGTINIASKLEKFAVSAKVTGSVNHDLLQEFTKMDQQFNYSSLELFKANMEAEKNKDSVVLDSLDKVYKSLIRRRYLYTTNFAVSHADKDIAPYLALTELYNANLVLLDTINNSLTEDIRNSKYGKQLDRYVTIIRNQEEPK